MRRLTAPCRFRLREKASVFLAEVHPAADPERRATVLAALRKREHDATHHCNAWRAGLPIHGEGSDDGGEPAGTAGDPMLRVLRGAEATDLLAVVIRWHGGTNLGTGGLVRAYTGAVQGALADAEAQGLWQQIRPMAHGRIALPPAQAYLAFQLLGAFPAPACAAKATMPKAPGWISRFPLGRKRHSNPHGGSVAAEAQWPGWGPSPMPDRCSPIPGHSTAGSAVGLRPGHEPMTALFFLLFTLAIPGLQVSGSAQYTGVRR